jgi:hypothetical protein
MLVRQERAFYAVRRQAEATVTIKNKKVPFCFKRNQNPRRHR